MNGRNIGVWKSVERMTGRGTLVAITIASLGACERNISPTGVVNSPAPHATIVTPAVADPLMGDLSPIARHISAALRDSAIRHELATAMKNRLGSHMGFDLQDCNDGGTTTRLLRAGEVYGAGAASSICSQIGAHGGLMLYMAASRLAVWNPRVSPVVTALVAPSKPIRDRVIAYRSPDRTIDIADPKFVGPILVVLPYKDSKRVAQAPAPRMSTTVVFGPTVLPQRGVKGSSSTPANVVVLLP